VEVGMNDLERPTDPDRLRTWLRGGIVAALIIGAYELYEFTQPAASPIVYNAGSVVAAAELDYVLDDPSKGGGASGITAGKLFASSSGDKCRRFAQGYLSGAACFRDGQWRLIEMTQAPLPPQN
jgi:hypothetical protein